MSFLILITEILISQRYNSNGGRLCLLKSSLSDSHLLSLKVPLKNSLKVTLKGSHILNLKLSFMITFMLTLKLHQGEPIRLVQTFLLPDEFKRINDLNAQYDSWKVSFQIKNKIKTLPKMFKDCVSYSCFC